LGFYKHSGKIIGYKDNTDTSFNTITEVFTYLSNEDISSVIGNAYDITLSEETSDSFQIDALPDGPLFVIYEDTYFNVTESNIFSAVDKWRYDKFDALALYGPISDWTLTDVYTMKDLFKDYTDFNEDISRWNTSTVTTMESMFQGTMVQSRYNTMGRICCNLYVVYVSRQYVVQSTYWQMDDYSSDFDGIYV